CTKVGRAAHIVNALDELVKHLTIRLGTHTTGKRRGEDDDEDELGREDTRCGRWAVAGPCDVAVAATVAARGRRPTALCAGRVGSAGGIRAWHADVELRVATRAE